MKKLHIVFGGAGFIGTNLVHHLFKNTHDDIAVIDNLARGKFEFVTDAIQDARLKFFECDAANEDECSKIFNILTFDDFSKVIVWHLAANSDIAAGTDNISIDFFDTLATTVAILKNMKAFGLKCLNFASSSAIYGNPGSDALKEDQLSHLPISNYGAMKLASEACISAACENYLESANIFRFPNVVGTPATHGVIYDFVNRLFVSQNELRVLGDGTQKKCYLHVSDLISAMLFMHDQGMNNRLQIVNIGPHDDGITVKDIAETVVCLFSPRPLIVYGTGDRGWIGDVPKFQYDTTKINNLGWAPRLGSYDAVRLASRQIFDQISASAYVQN